MKKVFGGDAEPGVRTARWNGKRTAYVCADAVEVLVPNRTLREDGLHRDRPQIAHLNGVAYKSSAGEDHVRVFVSGTGFDRDMMRVVRGQRGVRTITFPGTARTVLDSAFHSTALRSVVLNEGLESVGDLQSSTYAGAFGRTPLRRVTFPSTLCLIGAWTFYECRKLRRATFAAGSALKRIGEWAFSNCGLTSICFPEALETIGRNAFMWSGLEEATIRGALKEVGLNAFANCTRLVIYADEDLGVSLINAGIYNPARVGPPPGTSVGGVKVWDLREQKTIIIPDGAERIGSRWFWGCGVESVTIPTSVREIGIDAFSNCKSLRRVLFQTGSRLEKIGSGCFYNSALEEITVPRSVVEIQENAFK